MQYKIQSNVAVVFIPTVTNRYVLYMYYVVVVVVYLLHSGRAVLSQKKTLHRAQTKTNFAAIKLFETKKENEFHQTKRELR